MPFKYSKAATTGLVPGNYPNWRTALAKLRNGIGFPKILCVGDSTTWGFGSGGNPPGIGGGSWPSLLASLLNTHLAPTIGGNLGIVHPLGTTADTRFTALGGWSQLAQYGFGQLTGLFANVGAADLTYAPGINCDTIDVYYQQSPGLGTFQINIDGGANVPVVSNASPGQVSKATVTAAASAAHVLHLGTVTLTAVQALFFDAYLSTVPSIKVANAGVGSTDSQKWADQYLTATPASSLGCIAAYQPDLTIINLAGINDANVNSFATFQANLASIIAKAQLSGDVLLVSAQPSSSPPSAVSYEQQVALYFQSLSAGIGFVDLFSRLSPRATFATLGYFVDGLHCTKLGNSDTANAILSALIAIDA